MAEYIDRAKTQAYLYNNMMWYDEEGYIAEDSEKDKALWSLVNGVPTANVIERSKYESIRSQLLKDINEIAALSKANRDLYTKIDKAKSNIEIMLEQEKQADGTYTDVGEGIAIALGLFNNELGE